MLHRQLFDRATCTYTYLLADPDSGDAVLIDTVFEHHDRDTALLKELGLTLRYTLDTHCHADHVTGAWLLKRALGSQIAMAAVIGAENVDVPLSHGDTITFGPYTLEVRATPGHTDGCLSYVLSDQSAVYTGDALLIRGAGRTDFQAGNAGQLYQSIREQLFSLPDTCVVYPGHDYVGRTSSTVGEEKAHNPRIGGHATERDFVGYMENLGLPHPGRIDVALPANMVSGRADDVWEAREDWAPLVHTFGGVVEVHGPWVSGHLDDVHVLDVRYAYELEEGLGAIPGCQCIPLGELRDRLDEVPSDKPIVTVCHAGKRSAMAAKILRDAGRERVANVHGGMVEWTQHALPVER